MTSPLQRLLELPISGELLILTHDNPDPDSISSAAAMQYLMREKRSIGSVIGYSGVIGRAENRAMVKLLELPIVPVEQIDPAAFPNVALIDAQPETGNHSLPASRIPDIVIDHHPLREATRQARFYDVRQNLGASATLMTLYLRDANLKIPSKLATALLYGIRSETQDLGREVADDDVTAYELLFPVADRRVLAEISRPRLRPDYFRHLAFALDGLMIGQSSAVALLGDVNDPDFVPEMADLIVRMEGIEWGLCTGAVGDKLYVSIRTNDRDANAGELMQTILKGLGSGGGHGMRGGGNVELSSSDTPRQALEGEIGRRFMKERGGSLDTLMRFRGTP